MRTVVLDYETYYDKDYSLRKMTPVEYILDPRFETILCAVKEVPDGVTYVVDGIDFEKWLKSADLENCCVVSHNALFDMSILSYRYGVRPRLMVDTLGVSRALLQHELRSLALGRVAEHLGLGSKGGEVDNVQGMNRAAIKACGRWHAYERYSANDADLCAGIYDKLVRSGLFPVREIAVMDMVLRCATEPRIVLDQTAIAEHLASVQQKKLELLASAMLVGAQNGKKDLMSNEAFAEILRGLGVDPPKKISPITGKWAYAFAKTDKDFIKLEEHPDPAVQIMVAARTGHKSTLEESRSQRLLDIANLTWRGNSQQLMPIPLKYGGAHTGRLSGDWKLNMQNLPRGGNLRRALLAPPGHTIVTADASQIEARIVAWLCEEWELVNDFGYGVDVYSKFASEIFAILGLGYQVGAPKFQNTIEVQSQLQLGQKIQMSLDQAEVVVNFYRSKYQNISSTWKRLHTNGMNALAHGVFKFTIGPCEFEHQAIRLPTGLRLHYHGLHMVRDLDGFNEWRFTYGPEFKKLYGGKLLENMVQALAIGITMDCALRIQKQFKLAMQVHDELVYVVPDEQVEACEALLRKEMCRPPTWAPDLPLAVDIGKGKTYGDAK